MTAPDKVLSIQSLSKKYKIYPTPWHRLREWLSFSTRISHEVYWAVKGVSFSLTKGEFLGIIGPNGAGKSTLLKMIANVTSPTEGSIKVSGRVLSILELSSGMDSLLTGRENVIRSGQLLGLSNEYVKSRIDDIKEFSELDDFFEKPLRTYSTGMQTRLAFSMFAFFDCDILILDEVLAVGDIFFKQKCFVHLEKLVEKGTSILLVTHNMGVVQRYCKRAIVLNKGEEIYQGDAAKAVSIFLQLRNKRGLGLVESAKETENNIESFLLTEDVDFFSKKQQDKDTLNIWPKEDAFLTRGFPKIKGSGRARLLRLAVLNDKGVPHLTFKQSERVHIFLEYVLLQDIDMPVLKLEIRDKFNSLIHSKNSLQAKTEVPSFFQEGDLLRWHQELTLNLAPKNYIFNIELSSVNGTKKTRLSYLPQAFATIVSPYAQDGIELIHGGVADLPSKFHVILQANDDSYGNKDNKE